MQILKETIRRMILDAGFVRVRFLAPFEPEQFFKSGRSGAAIPENYRQGSPALALAALPYGNGQAKAGENGGGKAFIAPFAQRNYYREAVKRLQKTALKLRSHYGGEKSDYRILCNSPIPEKPLAIACGLGSLGRNSLVITREAGSLVILAALTLPFSVETDMPETFSPCSRCSSGTPPCALACPTGALRNGVLDRERCIQWYASGNGNKAPDEAAQKWGNRLYGCTACQDACIENRRPIPGIQTDEGPLPESFEIEELLALSDDELKARFKGTAMGLTWLGPAAIRRNVRMIQQYNRLHKIT
jgi:epoxyqueuosine reductase